MVSKEFPLEELRQLLKKAQNLDVNCKRFGANVHNYQWNPPASIKEIEAFEQEIGVKLPEEYRDFLLLAGDGGAGPFYGLFSLKEIRGWLDWEIQPQKNPWLYPGLTIPEEEEQDGIPEWEECRRGCIPIGSQGDSYFTYLLVTGPNRGQVVYIEDDLLYLFFPREQGFLAWYTRWLREVAGGYYIFWFATNLDGGEEELRQQYAKAVTKEEKALILSSMKKFPCLSKEFGAWIVTIAQEYVKEPDARLILQFLQKVNPQYKDVFMEQRWESGMYDGIISEVFQSIRLFPENENAILEHWGERILKVLPQVSQKHWFLAFQMLTKCPWLRLNDVVGLWEIAEQEVKPDLMEAFGKFPDANEYLEFFLKSMEEREDLTLLKVTLRSIPVVKNETLYSALKHICQDFAYSMEPVSAATRRNETWEQSHHRDEAITIYETACYLLEVVHEKFIHSKVLEPLKPYRLLLKVSDRQELGIDNVHEEDGIAIHPFIALVIEETYGVLPSTVYDWDKIFLEIKNLKLRPERWQIRSRENHWIYIVPPNRHIALPKPYYYNLHDWSAVGRMVHLNRLTIEKICIDDFSFLTQCKNVEILSLRNTNFSDCRLLCKMPKLKKLDLRDCQLEYENVLKEMNVDCRR